MALSLEQNLQVLGGNDPGGCDTILSSSDNNEADTGGLVVIGGQTYSSTLTSGVTNTNCLNTPIPFVLLKNAETPSAIWTKYFSDTRSVTTGGVTYTSQPLEVTFVGFPKYISTLPYTPYPPGTRSTLSTYIGVVVKYGQNIPKMHMYHLLDASNGNIIYSHFIPVSFSTTKIHPHIAYDNTGTIRFFLPFSEMVNGLLNYGVFVFIQNQDLKKVYQTTSETGSVGATSVSHIDSNFYIGGGVVSEVSGGTMKPFITKILLTDFTTVWTKVIDSLDLTSRYRLSHQYIEVMEASCSFDQIHTQFSERDQNQDLKQFGFHYVLTINNDDSYYGFTTLCNNVFTLLTLDMIQTFNYRQIQGIQRSSNLFQVNYVVGNDLNDVKNGNVGLSGYQTTFEGFYSQQCDEDIQKHQLSSSDIGLWIGSDWSTPPTQYSFWQGRSCYQHTSANPICTNLITDFRIKDYLSMHSTFLATATHRYQDSLTDAEDEGAFMLSGEPSGVLVPLNENNGRTGKAILLGQFKGSTTHNGNENTISQMRVENSFLQFNDLNSAIVETVTYPTCSDLSLTTSCSINIQKEFGDLTYTIPYSDIRNCFNSLTEIVVGIQVDTGNTGYVSTDLFTINNDLSITLKSRLSTVDPEVRDQSFSVTLSVECYQSGSNTIPAIVSVPLMVSLTDCNSQRVLVSDGVVQLSIKQGQGKLQLISGTQVMSYFSLRYSDRCQSFTWTYDLVQQINGVYQPFSGSHQAVILNSDKSLTVDSDISFSYLYFAIRTTDQNFAQSLKYIQIVTDCYYQQVVASNGIIQLQLEKGKGKVQILTGSQVMSYFHLKYTDRCQQYPWTIEISSFSGLIGTPQSSFLATLNSDNSLMINTNTSLNVFEFMIIVKANSTIQASKIVMLTFVNITSEITTDQQQGTNSSLSQGINSSSLQISNSNKTQVQSAVGEYYKSLLIKRNENNSKRLENQTARNISISFQDVSRTGLITLKFSEPLRPIDLMHPLKLEDLSDPQFLTLNYSSELNQNEQTSKNITVPELKSWKVVEFSNSYLRILLNFSNPELVSINKKLDYVRLSLEGPLIFQSLETNKTLENRVILQFSLPKQLLSLEEEKLIQQLGKIAEGSILFLLLLQLALKILAKLDMELMWTLISYLQIIISFTKINGDPISQNLNEFLQYLSRVVYFKITQIPQVKDYIDNSLSKYKETINSAGDEIIILAIMLLTLAFVVIIGYLVRKREQLSQKVTDLKNKLVWTPVITFILQSYYPFILQSFIQISNPQLDKSPISSFVKALFLLIFPVSSYLYLRHNNYNLNSEEFQRKYGQLFLGVKQKLGETKLTILVELGIKLTFALIIGLCNTPSGLAIPLLIIVSLFGACWQLAIADSFQRIEVGAMKVFNSIFLLTMSASMMVMSDLVDDGMIRYQAGNVMMWAVVLMIGVNLSVLSFFRVNDIWVFIMKKMKERELKKKNLIEIIGTEAVDEERRNQELIELAIQQGARQMIREEISVSSDSDSSQSEQENQEISGEQNVQTPRWQEETKEESKQDGRIPAETQKSFGIQKANDTQLQTSLDLNPVISELSIQTIEELVQETEKRVIENRDENKDEILLSNSLISYDVINNQGQTQINDWA